MLIDKLEPFRNFNDKRHFHKYTTPEENKRYWKM